MCRSVGDGHHPYSSGSACLFEAPPSPAVLFPLLDELNWVWEEGERGGGDVYVAGCYNMLKLYAIKLICSVCIHILTLV